MAIKTKIGKVRELLAQHAPGVECKAEYRMHGKGEIIISTPDTFARYAIDYAYRRKVKPKAWVARSRYTNKWEWHSHTDCDSLEDAVRHIAVRLRALSV